LAEQEVARIRAQAAEKIAETQRQARRDAQGSIAAMAPTAFFFPPTAVNPMHPMAFMAPREGGAQRPMQPNIVVPIPAMMPCVPVVQAPPMMMVAGHGAPLLGPGAFLFSALGPQLPLSAEFLPQGFRSRNSLLSPEQMASIERSL
jgi:hypothetical protein